MNFTETQLEIESDCKIYTKHECDENELPEYLRLYKISMNESSTENHWELFSIWLANENDVASGEAEEVGEVMNLSSMKVNFCPYCGLNLNEIT